jgi:hypothetical protein
MRGSPCVNSSSFRRMAAIPRYSVRGVSRTESAASGQTTLRGCLQSSDGNYGFRINPRTYQFRSKTSKPAAYVGREVQITTSTPTAIAIASSSGAEQSGAQRPVLTAKDVKQVLATCQSVPHK